jgi:hypothetical protein
MEQQAIDQLTDATTRDQTAADEREARIAERRLHIERAQQSVRRYIEPGRSLSDELIAGRREAAKSE